MFSDTNTNSCSDILNRVCETGYSLYFPCIKNVTRGENTCFDFYVVDNVEREEIDLRDVDDITLNMSGRYNCNFGSYSYPDNIEYVQHEDFSEKLYDTDLSDIIIHNVDMYIDEVDEYYNVTRSFFLGEENFRLCIDGVVGKFLEGSEKYGVLDLVANDTSNHIFLGWYVEENDECESGNKYDRLIKSNRLTFNVTDDFVIRAVYRKRKIYDIKISPDNVNSNFAVEYMNTTTKLTSDRQYVKVLEGHDVKLRCLPHEIYTSDNQLKPCKFVKWDDGFESPYRILKVGGDNNVIYLKAYCSPDEVENIKYIDDIKLLNNFFTTRPEKRDIFRTKDGIIFDNLFLYNCDIVPNEGNGVTYIVLSNEDNYLQIVNINDVGRMTIIVNVDYSMSSGIPKVFLGNDEILHSDLGFVFDYNGESLVIRGGSGGRIFITSLYILKEVIYDKGKCRFCLNSDETLKLQPGEITVDGGVVVNENPYGISPVKIANVTTVTPLKINNII